MTDDQIEVIFYCRDIRLPTTETGFRGKFLAAAKDIWNCALASAATLADEAEEGPSAGPAIRALQV